MIFRTSSPWNLETSNRTSGLQDSLALGLQNLQVLNARDVLQNFCLQNVQALDQKQILQRLGLVHQNFLCQSLQMLHGNSSELADADDLLIKNMSSEAL